jgi:hypothetical protein
MASDLSEINEIMEFINDIIGSTHKITINSGPAELPSSLWRNPVRDYIRT